MREFLQTRLHNAVAVEVINDTCVNHVRVEHLKPTQMNQWFRRKNKETINIYRTKPELLPTTAGPGRTEDLSEIEESLLYCINYIKSSTRLVAHPMTFLGKTLRLDL